MYCSHLSDEEKSKLNSFEKVIIWGFPLHTHTHSYIHAMWKKVFKEGFDKETYWFHEKEFPSEFNYGNCLFITEGYADANIPIVESSVYFVHNAIDPTKYRNARLIDIRFNLNEMRDINYDFKLDDGTHNLIELSNETKYERLTSNRDLYKKELTQIEYETIYMYWATDLLPHEFDYNIQVTHEPTIYYIGSPCITYNLQRFIQLCKANQIKFIHNDPWVNPISFEDNQMAMKKSLLCPDFRPISSPKDIEEFGIKNGKNHMEIGYLPCRILKAISYGKLGMTDCPGVKEILKEHVLYESDMFELLKRAVSERSDTERIKKAMKYVEEHHTYVQRVRDMMRSLLR